MREVTNSGTSVCGPWDDWLHEKPFRGYFDVKIETAG